MRAIVKALVAVGAASALATTACAGDTAARSAGQVIDDATITATVKSRLIADDDTKARQINVETSAGVVQLNGFVDSATARAEAERLASQADGVKKVRNNLEVRTANRSTGEVVDDVELTAKVDAALAVDPRTSALRIDVETREGEVQLSGFAKSPAEKSAAAEVARNVSGVDRVRNEIDVR